MKWGRRLAMRLTGVSGPVRQAARDMRSPWRHASAVLSDRRTTVPAQTGRTARGPTAPKPCPDFALLAALVLGGLISPEAAVLIAILEHDRHDARHGRR
jgi:hypothetical protein